MQTITIQKNKLPEWWEVKKLGDVCEFVTSGATPTVSNLNFYSNEKQGIPFLRIQNISENYLILSDVKYITKEVHNTPLKRSQVKPYDVLVTITGRLGTAVSVPPTMKVANINQHICLMRINKKLANSKYIAYHLNSDFSHKEIMSKQSGTTRIALNHKTIQSLNIILPPLPVQQKIVQKLDAFFESYNKLKQEKQKAKEKYEKILQSVIASLIPQDKLPNGWEKKELKEATEIIMGQSPPSKTYNSDGKGLPFFQGKTEFGERHQITKKWCNEPKKIAEKGDILMSVRAPVGPVNISNQKCCIGRGLCSIRAKKNLDYLFLYYVLKFKEKILAEQGSGSTFNAISKKDVEKIIIPIGPLDRQKLIVRKLEKIHELIIHSIEKEQNSIDFQLEQLPKAVLSKAFKGELV